MKHRSIVRLSFVLAVSLALVGCETTGTGLQNPFSPLTSAQATPGLPVSPAEQAMLEDQKRFNDTVISGVLTGAVVGGVGAAILAKLSGEKGKNIRNAALGGTVIGATAGGIDAYVTAKQEQSKRERIRAVQAAANDVRADNQRLQSYIESSNRVLEEGLTRLASLQRDISSRRISAEEVRLAQQREERNIGSMTEALATARKTRDQYIEAAAQLPDSHGDKRNLDAEISQMNAQIKKLESNVAAYNRALQVSRA